MKPKDYRDFGVTVMCMLAWGTGLFLFCNYVGEFLIAKLVKPIDAGLLALVAYVFLTGLGMYLYGAYKGWREKE